MVMGSDWRRFLLAPDSTNRSRSSMIVLSGTGVLRTGPRRGLGVCPSVTDPFDEAAGEIGFESKRRPGDNGVAGGEDGMFSQVTSVMLLRHTNVVVLGTEEC